MAGRNVDGRMDGLPARKVVAAQGILPEDGADARLIWKVDTGLITSPLPRRPDGLPDYFAYDPAQRVQAGQILASIIPPQSGTPGKTPAPPLREIPQGKGKDIALRNGPGVRLSDDSLHYLAACDGFVELRGNCLSVHALKRITEDIGSGTHEFGSGLIALGRVQSGTLRAQGLVAIRGAVAGATVRARGDVFLTRAARARIITEGNVYVFGTLLHCEVITPRRLIALDGATMSGGNLVATEGVEAVELGAPDFTETRVEAGVERFSQCRLGEVEKEIATGRLNVQKISQALRPLSVLSSEPLPEQKKKLLQTLVEQRRMLEKYVSDLHNEQRALMMRSKSRFAGSVTVSGTVHPGVAIALRSAAMLVERPQQNVRFEEDASGRSVVVHSLSNLQAEG
jgi:uncharacterized protein (DUF342 family)